MAHKCRWTNKIFKKGLTISPTDAIIIIEREVMSMFRNIIELENKIKAERIELAKTYVVNNGMNPKLMTEDDLFAIYSCLMVKAQKRMNENLDKLIDSMV